MIINSEMNLYFDVPNMIDVRVCVCVNLKKMCLLALPMYYL